MRQIYKGAILTIVAILLCFYAAVPPEKNLRLGKDLRGGVSLIYSVQLSPGDDPKVVLPNLIDTLKRRVDPNGVMEIAMVAVGDDRIEITMPLPNDAVKARRAAYEDALLRLGEAALSEPRIEQFVRLSGAERDAAIEKLAGGNKAREARLRETAGAYEAMLSARAAYNAAPPAERDAMVEQVASAELAYDRSREAALATALSAEEVRRVLQASTRVRLIRGSREEGLVQMPSPRQVAEQRLRADHPDSTAEIDQIIALHSDYISGRTSLDDPNDLIRMLKGAGVLSFRITVNPGQHTDEARLRDELRQVGPRNVKSSDARWYRINQIESWIDNKAEADFLAAAPENAVSFFQSRGYVVEPYQGEYYMLGWDTRGSRLTTAEGTWSVASASQGIDQTGRGAINFAMSPQGSVLLGNLTREHVGEKMAVMLDDEVYTAPNLRSEISSNGQITGDFPPEEIKYIVRVLQGGSLQAKLSPEPISVSSIGPELGADNLRQGLKAGLLSIIIVAGFMIAYYFGLGFVAVLALLVNAILILGAMAAAKAAFTMPGIAGVILTFGMAVDSNVLIYERMREETQRGNDIKTSARLGFDRALASIVDGNITNLIVCVVLYYTGTPEIRGFAITLGIGVVSTLFSALVVTRMLINVGIKMGWTRVNMLPMAISGLQRALTPTVDWLKLRYVFFTISGVYVLFGLGLVFYRGAEMLDNEFRGGTQITLQFRQDGQPVKMSRAEVEERVIAIADAASRNDQLVELRNAEVFPLNPDADGVTSDRFTIKTIATNANAVQEAVVGAFRDKIDRLEAVSFAGSEATDARVAPVFAIERPQLGDNINVPNVRTGVTAFMGGAAVVMQNLSPAVSLKDLRERIQAVRESAEFSDTISRQTDVIVLEGTEDAVKSAVMIVFDPSATFFDNEARWETEVRAKEWALVQSALTIPGTPASVQAFSPAIAETFKNNALLATFLSFIFIGIYIWIRFQAPRYSIAAVVALVHDVLTVLALIAVCEVLYETPATGGFARSLGLLPFKIDLNLVAALLTIAGYSLNDTVVVMDRIRENRGKVPYASAEVINNSINQTFSRTVITGGTTLFSCLVLYLIGGEGMRAFAFALMTGLIFGTYSSVAIAAPIVWVGRKKDTVSPTDAPGTSSEAATSLAAR